MEYTKGNWERVGGTIYARDGKDVKAIAHLLPLEEKEANGDLIIQAPRLYEACGNAQLLLRQTKAYIEDRLLQEAIDNNIQEIKQAIAEVKSETEPKPSPWGLTKEEAELEGK